MLSSEKGCISDQQPLSEMCSRAQVGIDLLGRTLTMAGGRQEG